MIEKVKRLKRFIEIIDSEIFPEKPCEVYLVKRKLAIAGAGIAAFTTTKDGVTVINTYLKICSYAAQYLYLLCIYQIYRISIVVTHRQLRKIRVDMLRARQLIHLLSMITNDMFYKVAITSEFKNCGDYQLLLVAFHEVRHRVQHMQYYETLNEEQNAIILEVARKTHSFCLSQVNADFYGSDKVDWEVDSNIIAYFLVEAASIHFKGASVDEEGLKTLLKNYSHIMRWKNPDIKL